MERGPLTPLDAAYLAALIDGEGSITINQRTPTLAVAMCDPQAVRWLSESFSRPVEYRPPSSKRESRSSFSVRFYGQQVASVLRSIMPYLKVKTYQAELVLEWLGLHPGCSRRQAIERELKVVKRIEHGVWA